jgi:hypothetical protein
VRGESLCGADRPERLVAGVTCATARGLARWRPLSGPTRR